MSTLKNGIFEVKVWCHIFIYSYPTIYIYNLLLLCDLLRVLIGCVQSNSQIIIIDLTTASHISISIQEMNLKCLNIDIEKLHVTNMFYDYY